MAEKKDSGRTVTACLLVVALQTAALVLMFMDGRQLHQDIETLKPTIRDWIAAVPPIPRLCWLWTYLAFCWLLYGPMWTRRIWNDPEWSAWWWRPYKTDGGFTKTPVKGEDIGEMPLVFVWFFAPLWLPVRVFWGVLWTLVIPPLDWLLYGSPKTWEQDTVEKLTRGR